MDLEEFVTVTLSQVAKGVKNAQEAFEDCGGAIAPAHLRTTGERDLVEFDVAVLVSSEKGSGGKIEVAAFGIGAGLDGGSNSTEQTTSRVRFQVPVLLPPGETHKNLERVREVNARRNKVTE